MVKFRITYRVSTAKKEDVEADDYIDEGVWITFRNLRLGGAGKIGQVLRVRAAEVKRIERVNQ